MNINDIKELKVKEVFEEQILEDLFEVRDDGFKATYNKMFDEPLEGNGITLDGIEDKIKNIVKDTEQQKALYELFEESYEKALAEAAFWSKAYYKYGFIDGTYLKLHTRKIKKLLYGKNSKVNRICSKIKATIREIIKCKRD